MSAGQHGGQLSIEELRKDVIGEGAAFATPFGVRRLTYADYIASGRPLRSVEATLERSVLPLYANTHTEDSATGAHTTALADSARDYVKRCLGGEDTHKLFFVGTGATGAVKRFQEVLGVSVAPELRQMVLSDLPTANRWVVFVGPYEHHSNEVSWRESLAEVVAIPLAVDGTLDLAALKAALEDPRYLGRPRVGSFSAASNVTGLITDVRAVAKLLHEHDAIAAFDFAASAPYVAIDVQESSPGANDGIDAVMLSPHKFLGGPGSPGVLLVRKELYHLTSPTTAGGGTVLYVSHVTHRFVSDVESREDAGTPAILQKLRAAMAFRVKERVGADFIARREEEHIGVALRRLAANPKVEVLGSLDAPRLAVLSFLVKPAGRYLHPRFVVRLLSDLFGIQGRAGCSCAGPYGHDLLGIDGETSVRFLHEMEAGFEGLKPGWSRVSFHYLCDEAELEFLLAAIEFLAEEGDAFLPLYDFDWQTGAWCHRGTPPETRVDDFAPEAWEAIATASGERLADYAAYLAEARQLARELRAAPPLAPDRSTAADTRLANFQY
ncbi:MAG TPA: aminotransferase class V-fold PLP-dependent enzyme [Trueperaceae bacterium]|nr:aminotransferase class V-fold PLP-dependent enzyme [Trueperaceae bacterium]